jgi:hypothetical protein
MRIKIDWLPLNGLVAYWNHGPRFIVALHERGKWGLVHRVRVLAVLEPQIGSEEPKEVETWVNC